MAKAKLIIDLRREMNDRCFPIKIYVTHKGKSFIIKTPFKAKKNEWDINQFDIKSNNARAKNIALRSLINRVENLIIKLEESGKLNVISGKVLKEYIEKDISGKNYNDKDFFSVLDKFVSLKNNLRTRNVYEWTKDTIIKFDTDANFDSIDITWLKRFENYLINKGSKTNTIAIHFRNIRSVFNYAIDEEIINKYPFRRFKIKKEETIKRSMTIDELRLLKDYKCEEHQEKYRDLFMLTFYLIGINSIDLFNLKTITKGRIEYYRAKTKKLYSIEVLPPAMDIINKYKGEKYLLNILDNYKDYKDFSKRMNRNLKEIGEIKRVGLGGKKIRNPLFPDITIYHARHSWATIASELDIPKETISAALGHEIGSKITGIYINFDMKKVDEANRKVMNYLFGGEIR
jgi:site-specific recombinase XerD